MKETINPNDLLVIIENGEEIKEIMDRYDIKGDIMKGYLWAKELYEKEFIEDIDEEQ